MKMSIRFSLLLSLLMPSLVFAATQPPTTQQVSEVEDRIRKLQEILNEMELKSEDVKSSVDRSRPQAIKIRGSELRLDTVTVFPNYLTATGAAYIDSVTGLQKFLTITGKPDFDTQTGERARITFDLEPHSTVKGFFTVEMIGQVAPNRLLPQNEIKKEIAGEHVYLREAEITLDNDLLRARAFRLISHPELYEQGDFYNLFPAADDVEKYWRQSGRAVPSGFQLSPRKWLDGLDIWYGNELLYGANPIAFTHYHRPLGPINVGLMWKAEYVPPPARYEAHKQVNEYEAWVKVPLGDRLNVDLVGVFTPLKVGATYVTVEEVAPGTGTSGTSYLKETVSTTNADAIGFQARFKGDIIPFTDDAHLVIEYSNPLAGNLFRVNLMTAIRAQRYVLFTIDATQQKPLVGPLPLINGGTPSIPLGTFVSPRPFDSAANVGTNPISGRLNREMTEIVLTLEINPGQGWFYLWRPAIVQGWNLNPNLNTNFSTAVQVRMFNFPTTTDRLSYIDENGQVQGEGPAASGFLPTDGFQYSFGSLTVVKTGPVKWVADINGGRDFRGLSPVIGDAAVKNSIFSLSGDLSAQYDKVTLSGGYAEDIWGPEDWHRQFGFVIGNRFKAGLKVAFDKSEFAINYEGWRNKNHNKYAFKGTEPGLLTAEGLLPIVLPIDQIVTSYSIFF